jgi:hypothetical protein
LADIKTQLIEHLEKGADWEKMDTPILGVQIVKIPATKKRDAILQLELNPIKDGKPIKRKGLFIGKKEILILFSELLSDDKVFQLMQNLDEVNPDGNSKGKKLDMGD